VSRVPWSLAELIAPVTIAEFRERYWQKRAFATKIPPGALAWLRSELEDFDPERLVRRYRGQIALWFLTLNGEQRVAAAANHDDALALYHSGKTIFMVNGGATPAIVRWERQLGEDAGHPSIPLTASLFLSKRSGGTAMHFDMLENFTIQLTGYKRWRVAPNRSVVNPLENWAVGQPVSKALAATLHAPLPTQMPDDAETFDLEAGSLLYIPRAHYHETSAVAEDSAALFLGMPLATWTDLLLDALRAHLERLPHWRENVSGGSSPDRVELARDRFEQLREGLARDLAGLSTEFMIPHATAPIDDARRLYRNPFAHVAITGTNVSVTLDLGKLSRKNELSLSEGAMPLVRWVCARDTLTLGETLEANPSFARHDVHGLLTVLQGAGLFT
jgi:hypothetical protein